MKRNGLSFVWHFKEIKQFCLFPQKKRKHLNLTELTKFSLFPQKKRKHLIKIVHFTLRKGIQTNSKSF